jgi:hypothetical protein
MALNGRASADRRWVRPGMSDNSELRNEESNEAVQAVLDRVLSWQAGAPVETVREELERGLAKVGETRPQEWLDRNARAISTADPAQS